MEGPNAVSHESQDDVPALPKYTSAISNAFSYGTVTALTVADRPPVRALFSIP